MIQFTAVLEALRTERDTLAARVTALTEAIGVIEKLGESPAPPAAAVHRRRSTAPAEPDDKGTRILAALRKRGEPMSPSDLQSETDLSAYLLTKALENLRAKHLVVITGASSAKRIALKEAP